ncbi:hypothetical protein IRJ41_008460 [Triplophysa rosa]|uniref:Uncharacterized protein n=1 Tax=Triplophysa rosa TaxID=992332 RepID=A0A9W8CB36_TRIRA|nr:hypothetical protein IRJ41_008460 [Triplophysa rosa]
MYKFPWYDDLDNILGTNPDVDPVNVVEITMRLMLAQLTGLTLPHLTHDVDGDCSCKNH